MADFRATPLLTIQRESKTEMDNPAADDHRDDSTPQPTGSPKRASTRKQEDTGLPPQNQEATKSDYEPPTESAWSRWQKHKLAERVMGYFTGVVAVCAILQIFILVGGTGQTDRLIAAANIQAGAAQQIADASKRNAAAAESFSTSARNIKDEISNAEADFATLAGNSAASIRATQDQVRLDQRAWVAPIGITGAPALDQQFLIRIIAKNTGKTFAKKFRMGYAVQVGSNQVGPQFDKVGEKSRIFKSLSLLAPGSEYTSVSTVTGDGSEPRLPNPSLSDLEKFKSGERIVYAFGRMDYTDIFKKNHWTIFCFQLDRQLAWISCEKHNDADNNE